MTTLFFDTPMDDSERRSRLYRGDIFVYSPTQNTEAFCSFARELIEKAFGDGNPEKSQYRLEKDQYIDILKDLKPKFIHHPKSKTFVHNILADLGCDLNDTYFDVPRMRSSTSDGYLTTGIAYAWHPHRDTWYSAPGAQINVWIPISRLEPSNTVAFHTAYFDQIVQNDSSKYNYYEWNQKFRSMAAIQKDSDNRPLPGPLESVEMNSQIRVVCPIGGMVLFSGAQLHSSVPNDSGSTRFSIDFRVVSVSDIRESRGAPMQDVACTGSNIRDFLRASDNAQMPDEIAALFNDGTESSGVLRFNKS